MRKFKKQTVFYKYVIVIVIIIALGYLLPQNFAMPVQGATKNSYNQNAYWYYFWGKSVTHKGVDIFAKEGTAIHPATSGLVIYTGQIAMGGNVVFILGPKWRFHYYAHVNEIKTSTLRFVSKKSIIATVGATGNAKGKSPHLHYSIMTLFPYFWLADKSVQGWKKMFYLNPITYLNDALNNTSAQ